MVDTSIPHSDSHLSPGLGSANEDSLSGLEPFIGGTSLIQRLLKSLHYGDASRIEQIKLMLPRQGKDAIPGLTRCLNNTDIDFRCAAVEIMGEIGDPCAIEPLLQVLEDDVPLIQCLIINALVNIGDSQALHSLLDYICHDNLSVSLAAIYAFGELGDETVRAILSSHLTSTNYEIRKALIKTLNKLPGSGNRH